MPEPIAASVDAIYPLLWAPGEAGDEQANIAEIKYCLSFCGGGGF
jgi:hypothetical protein